MTEPLSNMPSKMDDCAIVLNEWFTSLVRAGFNEEQALRLVALAFAQL